MHDIITATLYGVEVIGVDLDTQIQVISIPETGTSDYWGEWYFGGERPIRVGGTYPLVDSND